MPNGILDSIYARRFADWQVGTKEWSQAVEQRNQGYRLAVTCAVWQLGLYGVCRLSVVHRA